jgi:hypothetical protein
MTIRNLLSSVLPYCQLLREKEELASGRLNFLNCLVGIVSTQLQGRKKMPTESKPKCLGPEVSQSLDFFFFKSLDVCLCAKGDRNGSQV